MFLLFFLLLAMCRKQATLSIAITKKKAKQRNENYVRGSGEWTFGLAEPSSNPIPHEQTLYAPNYRFKRKENIFVKVRERKRNSFVKTKIIIFMKKSLHPKHFNFKL